MKYSLQKMILVVASIVLLVSCYDHENFSSNPNLMIQLDVEELAFDTIFSSVAVPLKQMKIYNKNNKSLNFSRIYLGREQYSAFRMNVNGRYGTAVEDVELLKNDSIYLFLDVNSEIERADLFAKIDDELVLEWNGNTKRIPLTALQAKVEVWDAHTVHENETIDKDIYLKGTLRINEGKSLIINPGVTLYFTQSAGVEVQGTLDVRGTVDNPVVFRGSGVNTASTGVLYDNMPSQWQGIKIGNTSYGNILEYVHIKNPQWGIDIEASEVDKLKLTLENSILHNTTNFGLRAINSKINIFNAQITNSGGALIHCVGGELNVVYSTIANYYKWYSRTSSSFVLTNTDATTSKFYPLNDCFVVNSIIVGSRRQELNMALESDVAIPLLFQNCVLQLESLPSDLSYFSSCIWDVSATASPFPFKYLNEDGDYVYNFQLPAQSAAIGTADFSYSYSFPYDLLGRSRMLGDVSDIGCYEYQP